MVFHLPLYLQCLQFFTIVCIADNTDFVFPEELYEGSPCVLNGNNEKGICKNLTQCPIILSDLRTGLRHPNSKDRCGLFGAKELVCCPLQQASGQFGLRPADVACQQIEHESKLSGGLISGTFGGEESVNEEFSFMAALGYPDQNSRNGIHYDCGGSLITTDYVLTSAHCVVNKQHKVPVEVLIGSTNLNINTEDMQRIQIEHTYPHPRYSIRAHYYDIALIKLRNSVRITATVKPVCLYTKHISNEITTNGALKVAGYAIAKSGKFSSEKLLESFGLRLVSKSACEGAFINLRRLTFGLDESMLCGKDINETRGFDVCDGDSGGPMILRKTNTHSLVGIISFGSGCISVSPTVYITIYPYLDWIESIVWGQ